MYCPRCGKPAENGELVCSNCGLDFATLNPAYAPKPESALAEVKEIAKGLKKLNIRLICFSIIALSILIISFIAAQKISGSAFEITQIRTSGGSTVNEVYYREMGKIYEGYAMFIRECGVFFATVLVGMGLRRPR
jgi:hypothetical protein